MHKGFTLLEVLISLIILSIIAVVSTNFLQSSVILKNHLITNLKRLENSILDHISSEEIS